LPMEVQQFPVVYAARSRYRVPHRIITWNTSHF
jgi:hypothetical protein